MNKILVIYDDTHKPTRDMAKIVGNKSYGEIIIKRKTLRDMFFSQLHQFDFIHGAYIYDEISNSDKLLRWMGQFPDAAPVVHLFSHFAYEEEALILLINKARFVKQQVSVSTPAPAGYLFHNQLAYAQFIKQSQTSGCTKMITEHMNFEKMQVKSFIDLSLPGNFIRYVAGGFDARFFNKIEGNDVILTKSSSNMKKIHDEYQFYHIIPDAMKIWFVMPFDYKESSDTASYSMERYQITDLAIRWVHGAITPDEFDNLMTRTFHFINSRSQKPLSLSEYRDRADAIYLKKTATRINELKASGHYDKIGRCMMTGTEFATIDDVFQDYQVIYQLIMKEVKFKSVCAIGHGDLCFSNMLYNDDAAILRLIDPRGASTQNDLWMDPYYDIAKLSHSICGRYDFFNSGLFDILYDKDMKFKLSIEFDNTIYIELFKKHLADNGFDFMLTRLFEASLFLSMLPLHLDYPQKVFAFLLNTIEIMKELRVCLSK